VIKGLIVCLLLFVTASLTACGETASQAANDGNAHLTGYRQATLKLDTDYGIVVHVDGLGGTHHVPSDLSLEQLQEAKTLLRTLINHGQGAITDSQHEGVIDMSNVIPKVQNGVDDAEQWLEAINSRIERMS
jgi:hypothetical protein